jgi:hypothetical protein
MIEIESQGACQTHGNAHNQVRGQHARHSNAHWEQCFRFAHCPDLLHFVHVDLLLCDTQIAAHAREETITHAGSKEVKGESSSSARTKALLGRKSK